MGKGGACDTFSEVVIPGAALHASLFGSKATLNSDVNRYVNLLLVFQLDTRVLTASLGHF